MERQENIYFKGIRDQQIDPLTDDLYPWWEPIIEESGLSGHIEFNPDKFDPAYPYKPKGSTFKITTNPEQTFENPFDLNNLRFIDPDDVQKAYDDLIKDAIENPGKLLTVLIGTGGTISMVTQDGNVLKPALDTKQIMAEAGKKIGEKFVTSSFSLPKLIDSSQMEIDYAADMVIAMSWLGRKLALEHGGLLFRFTGFIVCHGTDTAVQSQTYLSFMLGPNCPFNVFYVVAQRTVEDPNSDVGDNMRLALNASERFSAGEKFKRQPNQQCLCRGIHGICAGGPDGGVFNGPTSLKISDRDIKLMRDYNQDGPLLDFSGGRDRDGENTRFYHDMERYLDIATDRVDQAWLPLILRGESMTKKMESREGNSAESDEIVVRIVKEKFIIIETFGSFTANRKNLDAIVKAAHDTGKLVFATNPFPNGSTEHNYADAKNLEEQGVIPLRMLTHAAVAKLLLAFRIFGDDKFKIIKFMTENNFCNEQLYRDDIMDNSTVVKQYKRFIQVRDACVKVGGSEVANDLEKQVSLKLPEARKILQHEEFVNPPGTSDVENIRLGYFTRRETIYDMNDPVVRVSIEESRLKILNLMFSTLEPYIMRRITTLHLSGFEANLVRISIRNKINQVLAVENDGDLKSPLFSFLKTGRVDDVKLGDNQVHEEGGIGIVILSILNVIRKTLPQLGSSFDSEISDDDDLESFIGSIGGDIQETRRVGSIVGESLREKTLRGKMIEELVGAIPRFGMPKVGMPDFKMIEQTA